MIEEPTIRCFFGIPLEDLREIIEIQNSMTGWPFKMTDPDNLHMTILFLGDRKMSDIDGIISKMKGIQFKIPEFIVKSIIGLPRNSHARVLALSVSGVGLNKIYKKASEISKYTEKKEFLPHITIGRSKKPVSLNRSWTEKRLDLKLSVNRISLIRSDLTPDGPVYTELSSNYFI